MQCKRGPTGTDEHLECAEMVETKRQRTPTSILSLPDEILIFITSLLEQKDTLSLLYSNKRFNKPCKIRLYKRILICERHRDDFYIKLSKVRKFTLLSSWNKILLFFSYIYISIKNNENLEILGYIEELSSFNLLDRVNDNNNISSLISSEDFKKILLFRQYWEFVLNKLANLKKFVFPKLSIEKLFTIDYEIKLNLRKISINIDQDDDICGPLSTYKQLNKDKNYQDIFKFPELTSLVLNLDSNPRDLNYSNSLEVIYSILLNSNSNEKLLELELNGNFGELDKVHSNELKNHNFDQNISLKSSFLKGYQIGKSLSKTMSKKYKKKEELTFFFQEQTRRSLYNQEFFDFRRIGSLRTHRIKKLTKDGLNSYIKSYIEDVPSDAEFEEGEMTDEETDEGTEAEEEEEDEDEEEEDIGSDLEHGTKDENVDKLLESFYSYDNFLESDCENKSDKLSSLEIEKKFQTYLLKGIKFSRMTEILNEKTDSFTDNFRINLILKKLSKENFQFNNLKKLTLSNIDFYKTRLDSQLLVKYFQLIFPNFEKIEQLSLRNIIFNSTSAIDLESVDKTIIDIILKSFDEPFKSLKKVVYKTFLTKRFEPGSRTLEDLNNIINNSKKLETIIYFAPFDVTLKDFYDAFITSYFMQPDKQIQTISFVKLKDVVKVINKIINIKIFKKFQEFNNFHKIDKFSQKEYKKLAKLMNFYIKLDDYDCDLELNDNSKLKYEEYKYEFHYLFGSKVKIFFDNCHSLQKFIFFGYTFKREDF